MRFSKRHIISTISQALQRGTSPRKLAFTFALGVVVGIFPVWGISTWVCFGLAILFRINVVILQLVNYLVFPLQLTLIVPFIKIGTWIFSLKPFPYEPEELLDMFRADFLLVLKETGLSIMVGIGVWSVVAVPLFLTIFYITYLIFSQCNKSPNTN